jgi:Putative peptidoglycan binding domain
MNIKSISFASCIAAMTLSASVAIAAPHGGSVRAGHAFRSAGMAPGFARGGSRFGPGFSRGFRGDRDFRHHHGFRDRFFFFGDPFFFDPFFYGYYPYWYPPYGYYPYGYYPYGYGYGPSDPSVYPSVAVGKGSSVRELQLRLARAGYYHGPIDGIMGPRTRYALRAYERSRVTQR